MTTNEIKTKLESVDFWSGEAFDYEEDSKLYDVFYSLTNDYDETDDEDKIRDNLMEICDSMTPIYYHDLAEWFPGNWSCVDDYLADTGMEVGKQSIMSIIGQSYCHALLQDAYSLLQHLEDVELPESDNN